LSEQISYLESDSQNSAIINNNTRMVNTK
jgi:hypothetical protein